jgi:hypothetical protein
MPAVLTYLKYTRYDRTLPQVVLVDISYACMQASPDLAYGARVQSTLRLEENRRKN